MQAKDIFEKVDSQLVSAGQLAELIMADPKLTYILVEGMSSFNPRVSYPCMKALRIVSLAEPQIVYPFFDSFINLVRGQSPMVIVEALNILANLAKVDTHNKIEKFLDEFFAPLEGPTLLVAREVVDASARIVDKQPRLARRIASELMRVRLAHYESKEGRSIMVEAVLNRLDQMRTSQAQLARV